MIPITRGALSTLSALLLGTRLSGFSQQESLPPHTTPDQVPQSAQALWGSYDSTAEPLEVEIHHEWKTEGVTSRLISFKVGTFKGVDARIAAYYCFPDNGRKNPAFVWSHGGGQRADRIRGHYFATQGFATVDINWLGRPLEQDLDPTNEWGTDWGKIDPSQGPGFYPKALRKQFKSNFQPDEHSVDPVMSPRNSNWFMLSLAGRRALTFLEQQAEVNPSKLGFSGYSMGGTITSMTAIDPRLKAVAPFVGGTGYLNEDYAGMNSGGVIHGIKDISLYENTIDPGAYWKDVTIPVMFITSSNDFHSTFERIYQSMDLLGHQSWRVTGNLHANHGPGPEQWVMLNLWFQQYLAGKEQKIPATPPTTFTTSGNAAHFTVTPAQQERLKDVEIYYSHDPNSVTRFWKRATVVQRDGNSWKTALPIHPKLPLYTYALCRYHLPAEQLLERGSTNTFTLNSREHTHIPEDIDLAAYAGLPKTDLLDDFADGMQNWSSRDQATFSTYKFQDPELDTNPERKLSITLDLKEGQALLLDLGVKSKFLGGGKDLGSFNHGRRVAGNGQQAIVLTPRDFHNKDKKSLEWGKISTFSITLTDEKTKQRINLAAPEGAQILKRIELVK